MRWRAMATTLSVVLLSAMVAFAQGKPDKAGRGDKGQAQGAKAVARGLAGQESIIQGILQELDLSEEQKQKLDEIKAEFEKKTQGLRGELRNEAMNIRKFRDENPDDREGLRKKFTDLIQKAGPIRDALEGYVAEVKGVLNEEQRKKFNQLLDERGELVGMLERMGGGVLGFLGLSPRAADELALTPEQQEKIKAVGQAYADELKKLEEKYAGLVKETLTPEQQTKFDKAVEDAKNRPAGPGVMDGGRLGGKRLRPDRGEKPDRPPKDGGAAPNPAPPDEKPAV